MMNLGTFKIGATTLYILLALCATVLAIYMITRKRENFSFGDIFKKVKNVAVNVGNTVKNTGEGVFNKVKDTVAPGYVPQWTYRQWNGKTWSCPAGSYDYGQNDEHQCLVGDGTTGFAPQSWRWDGKQWGWSCPANFTQTGDSDWNKKCLAGATGRQYIDGSWKCNNTQTDTGANWGTTDWYNAQRQCALGSGYNTVFTTRMYINNSWQCPPSTRDTGFNWGDKMADGSDAGAFQCQYIGG